MGLDTLVRVWTGMGVLKPRWMCLNVTFGHIYFKLGLRYRNPNLRCVLVTLMVSAYKNVGGAKAHSLLLLPFKTTTEKVAPAPVCYAYAFHCRPKSLLDRRQHTKEFE